jgi:phage protein D
MTALLRPAYKLTFGGPATGAKVVDTTTNPTASTLTGLVVELGMTGAADRVELRLGRLGGLEPVVDQRLDVALGYTEGATLQQVCTATVAAVDPDPRSRRVVGYGAGHTLLRTFVDRTFENVTAGAIVKDLAAAAGVTVGTAEDGIRFPFYVVDQRRSTYRHVTDLATLCGFDAYVDPEGALVFAFFGGGRTTHVLEHGKHLLDLRLRRWAVPAAQFVVAGESGSSHGDNSWAWFAKDVTPVTGTAGTGARQLVERSAVRTAAAATQAAQAALTDARRAAVTGEALVSGAPQVRLGDTVRLSGTPGDGDGTYQVRALVHSVTKSTGFTTRIAFRSVET